MFCAIEPFSLPHYLLPLLTFLFFDGCIVSLLATLLHIVVLVSGCLTAFNVFQALPATLMQPLVASARVAFISDGCIRYSRDVSITFVIFCVRRFCFSELLQLYHHGT